jgi:hypothetical protein
LVHHLADVGLHITGLKDFWSRTGHQIHKSASERNVCDVGGPKPCPRTVDVQAFEQVGINSVSRGAPCWSSALGRSPQGPSASLAAEPAWGSPYIPHVYLNDPAWSDCRRLPGNNRLEDTPPIFLNTTFAISQIEIGDPLTDSCWSNLVPAPATLRPLQVRYIFKPPVFGAAAGTRIRRRSRTAGGGGGWMIYSMQYYSHIAGLGGAGI